MGLLGEKFLLLHGEARYSSLLPVTPDAARMLVEGLALGRAYIRKTLAAVQNYQRIQTPPKQRSDWQVVDQCLRYHFGLMEGNAATTISTVIANLKLIEADLSGYVRLKDARVIKILEAINAVGPSLFSPLYEKRDGLPPSGEMDPDLAALGFSFEPDPDDDLYGLLYPIYGHLFDSSEMLAEKGARAKLMKNDRIRDGVKQKLVGNSDSGHVGHVRPKKRINITLDDSDVEKVKRNEDVEKLNRPGARTNVHLDFGKVASYKAAFVAAGIIHETSHKVAYTHDHCYAYEAYQSLYMGLSSELKVKNADSYAMAAVSVGQGKLFEIHEDYC